MRRAHSIKARLAFVFLFLFLLVFVLGLESLSSLSYVNEASAQIRDRWLPSTRALGDLNNFTTDFPAAERAILRADSASERATLARQMADLDRAIFAAQRAYRGVHHDPAEDELYRRFEAKWSEYRNIVAPSQSRLSAAGGAAVLELHEEALKSAYDAASAAL